MSRVGKLPIKIAKGVKANLAGRVLKIEGPKGKLDFSLPEGIGLDVSGEEITVKVEAPSKKTPAMHGMVRSVVQNMVTGCAEEFKKEMDIIGVGYRAAVKGSVLNLTLGFSHPIDFDLPKGITAKVEKNTHLILTGADKVVLGETAAKIRGLRPPEPYQGKGIRYSDEHIARKQGKAAGAGAK